MLENRDAVCRAIYTARSEDQVIGILQRYLASLPPAQAAVLPVTFTGAALGHAEELGAMAFELTKRELLANFDAAEVDVLKDAAAVCLAASQRLAALGRSKG